MVVFTVGTGIGGGVVIDRKLRLGPLGAAGEIGHQTILPDGPLCGCGNRGCLETLAGGPALIGAGVRLIKSGHAPRLYEMAEGSADRVTPRLMAQAAAAGDSSVREELLRAARMLGIGVSNVIAVLYPDLVVLGGDVNNDVSPLLIDTARREVRERVRLFPVEGAHREFGAAGESRPVGRHCAGHRPRQTGVRARLPKRYKPSGAALQRARKMGAEDAHAEDACGGCVRRMRAPVDAGL